MQIRQHASPLGRSPRQRHQSSWSCIFKDSTSEPTSPLLGPQIENLPGSTQCLAASPTRDLGQVTYNRPSDIGLGERCEDAGHQIQEAAQAQSTAQESPHAYSPEDQIDRRQQLMASDLTREEHI